MFSFSVPTVFSLDKRDNLRFSNGLDIKDLTSMSEEELELFSKRLETTEGFDPLIYSFADGFLLCQFEDFICIVPSGIGDGFDLSGTDDFWSLEVRSIETEDDGISFRKTIKYYESPLAELL